MYKKNRGTMCIVIFGMVICIDNQFIILVLTGLTAFIFSVRMLWRKIFKR